MNSHVFSSVCALFAGVAVFAAPQLELGPAVETAAASKIHGKNPKDVYSKDQLEFYLTTAQVNFIRPGLNIAVERVEIPEDLQPVVTLTITDDFGQPLDRAGVKTPGPVSVRFILAAYDGGRREYRAYTTRVQTSPITGDAAEQATSDSGGTWTDLEEGRAEYRFGTALPAGFDRGKTHSLAIYANRDLRDLIDKRYFADLVYDFRPDGAEVVETWAAGTDASCNACHQDLAAHGGQRRGVKQCATCHSSQTVDPDTGNTVDWKVMVHKIHMGENLPSVRAGEPYQIIGFRQSVHDYSHIAFPQDVRNCVSCHPEDAPQNHHWFSFPSRDACGACHDNIDWVSGEGHAAGPAEDDSACANCHAPAGDLEFDASVIGAHTEPTKSTQLAGVNMDILSVQNTGPGETPIVSFKLYDDAGSAIAPSELDRLRFLLAGPTNDFARFQQEDGRGAAVDGDTATYAFQTPLPDDADGSWAISADVYRFADIDVGEEEPLSLRDAAFNPYLEFPVTDAQTTPRRQIVSLEKCNACHDVLSLHGGQRFAIEECNMCHGPNTDDSPVRPEEAGDPESVHFKYLIHRLHKGEDLINDFTVYGFRSSVHNYNELLYPGNLADCESCHLPGSYELPLPDTALPTVTLRDFYSPMQPAAAACLSCHDSEEAASHAFVNTAPFGEACAACHGPDREFSVSKVHAR